MLELTGYPSLIYSIWFLMRTTSKHTRLSARHHCVYALKTNTARLLRRDFRRELARFYSEPILWRRSYCVLSVGGAPLAVLRRYIEQQERPA